MDEDNEIAYHLYEKDGHVTAIWEMQGRKHMRTIDPRSEEGKRILGSHTADDDEPPAEDAGQQATA
ncbi:MAG: hypothetical protein DMF61_06595 [Blastocatellia bacterium AA13]|nr:MAG: hypothetical protein DMF61_06595 [Blastocatellia bacterium AA13]